ncbi:MAG: hypothetical protein E3J72_10340 [Planctomycetota bacterium]|nr:MAG: hypothetical protein E3J72_10340 [Planctomycetota bacterium]
MARKGRELEELIALIKETLIEENVEIKSPDYLFDKVAKIDREVDVTIKASIGPTPILISIECHDHSRKDDIKWVEEMLSKHEKLDTSKLILVSSSGFSNAALELSAHHEIETRVIREITTSEVRRWWNAENAFSRKLRSIVYKVSIDTSGTLLDSAFALTKELPPHEFSKNCFSRKPDGLIMNFNTLWSHFLRTGMDFFLDKIPPDGSKATFNRLSIEMSKNDTTQLIYTSGKKTLVVKKFIVWAEIWYELIRVPIKKISSYSKPDGEISQIIEYDVSKIKGTSRLFVHKDMQSGKETYRIEFRREKDEDQEDKK